MYRIRSLKVVSMCSNPDRAISEIKAVHTSARRAEGKVDLHTTFRELAHRARMEKRFSQSTSDWSMDNVERKLRFASDGVNEAEWVLNVS